MLRLFHSRGLLPAALVVVCILPWVRPAQSAEPQGFLLFDTEWAGGPGGGGTSPRGPRVLRVTISSREALSDVRVTLSTPAKIPVGPLDGSWDLELRQLPSGDTLRFARKSLGRIDSTGPAGPLVLELEIDVPMKGGGIASILVEGRTGKQRLVREGIGVPVGLPGLEGRRRNGAIEYPAIVTSAGDP